MSAGAFDLDAVVIGAGAVGLACAAALARRGRSVAVLEAADAIGTGTSSRNSEVIHAGLYYPTNSLKHRMCVIGRRRLYPYAALRGVTHHKVGKMIVATSAAEEAQLQALHQRALANDVENISVMSGEAARALEPNLNCIAALMSAETGIIDSHGLMLAYQGEIEDGGGWVALSTPFEGATPLAGGGFDVRAGGAEPFRLTCRALVNSAGLHAQAMAGRIEGLAAAHIPAQVLAKGSYFACAGKPAFKHLIYPAPVDGGLGVHLTLDLGGRMRFGPDVEWLETDDPARVDYAVDVARADSFYAAIRKYWPTLPDGALRADYSGCRPKLSGRGQPAADFRIDGADVHGLEGLVNLFGIESPGLTSSLAIAEEVVLRLEGRGATAVSELRPVVFFDRDATLTEDKGYTHKPEDLRWLPGAIEAIAHVNARGWLAVVVTNQAGIGRGYYDEAAMHAFHARMQEELAAHSARIDAFFHAPHHPEASLEALRHPNHPDRKPNGGMLLRAFTDLPADPMRALLLGDQAHDVEAARRAGVTGVQTSGGDLYGDLLRGIAATRWG